MQSQGLYYKQFIVPSIITLNGTYALHCGHYPSISVNHYTSSRFLAKKNSAEMQPCLPTMLKDHGYNTLYMQAVNLGYSRKNTLLKHMGFEHSLGKRQLQNNDRKVPGWGLSDQSFYKKVFKKVDALSKQDRPWFISTLNVGTHHPYKVPETFIPDEENQTKRAYHFVDKQIAGLFHKNA